MQQYLTSRVASGSTHPVWTAQTTQPLAARTMGQGYPRNHAPLPSFAPSMDAQCDTLNYSNTEQQSQFATSAFTAASPPLNSHQYPANANPAIFAEPMPLPVHCSRCHAWYSPQENGPQACTVAHPVAPLATRIAGRKAVYPGLYYPCCGLHQLTVAGLPWTPSTSCPATPHMPVPPPSGDLSEKFPPEGCEAVGCFVPPTTT